MPLVNCELFTADLGVFVCVSLIIYSDQNISRIRFVNWFSWHFWLVKNGPRTNRLVTLAITRFPAFFVSWRHWNVGADLTLLRTFLLFQLIIHLLCGPVVFCCANTVNTRWLYLHITNSFREVVAGCFVRQHLRLSWKRLTTVWRWHVRLTEAWKLWRSSYQLSWQLTSALMSHDMPHCQTSWSAAAHLCSLQLYALVSWSWNFRSSMN